MDFSKDVAKGLVSCGHSFQPNMFSWVMEAVETILRLQLSFHTDLGSTKQICLYKTWNAEISNVR